MDIPRPSQAKAKRKKRITMIVVAVLALGGITFGLSQLKPAAPTVDRNLVWVGTVERGPMVRQVRGLGTLVPENIRWVAASTQARVETIIIRPGAFVEPGTLILELSNPDVMQAAETAESSLQAAQAQLVNTRVQLESGLLQAESNAASAKAAYEQARLRYEVNKELFADGLVSTLELELYKITAEEAETRHQIEQKRYAFAQESIKPQLAVQEAEVARLEAQARLRQSEADALHVRATMAGVLSALPVEVGAQVQPGQNLAYLQVLLISARDKLEWEQSLAPATANLSATVAPLASVILARAEARLAGGDWGTIRLYTEDGTPTVDESSLLTAELEFKPGQQLQPPHQHAEEELQYVIAGVGTWFLNGVETPIQPGDLMYAKPWDWHGISNVNSDTQLRFLVVKWRVRDSAVAGTPPED